MIGKPIPAVRGRVLALAAGFLAVAWCATPVSAQSSGPVFATGSSPADSKPADARPAATVGFAEGNSTEGIVPASCSSCGGAGGTINGGYGSNGCGSGGCPSCCYALRNKKCDCCFGDGPFGKCIGGVVECLCCPDPCYVPEWLPVANSAFFVDAARPMTYGRVRYDAGFNFTNIDRGEYFMPRLHVGSNPISMAGQVGPANAGAPGNTTPGKGPSYIAGRTSYEDLSIYNEAAIGNFGLFMEMFYRELDPRTAPDSPAPAFPTSGFGDLIIGTKSLLLDCELLQFAFQFKTFIPTGNFTKGLGTAHASVEPAALATVKCSPSCYVQLEAAYWIPIGGDTLYESNIWHNHVSINKILCKPCETIQLIGTLEFNNWWVFQGSYTSPDVVFLGLAPAAVSATSGIFSMGPGIRLVICNELDVGVGSAFALTGDHWAQQLIRTEFRWRF